MSVGIITPETAEYLKLNLSEIRRKISSSKPDGTEVTLLAATKTIPAEVINYVTQSLGVSDIGENRVQELLSKYDMLDLRHVRLHFIGKLQPNKVKYIIDKVYMIHSLDSLHLASEIDKCAGKSGKKMPCLIEINIGKEESKSGILPEHFYDFLSEVSKFEHVSIRGLMTIAPVCSDSERKKFYFRQMFSLFREFQKRKDIISPPVLSMGMSASYPEAISCGSTCVRIGSALFGERVYS